MLFGKREFLENSTVVFIIMVTYNQIYLYLFCCPKKCTYIFKNI